MDSKKRRPSPASLMIGLGGRHSVNRDVLRTRLQEREQRAASDTRTEAERWLGDPPVAQSALASKAKGR